jgi:acetolactate synthase-1/2/3 large subunit
MKASEIFVKALEKEGIKYIFGVPGEENLDLLESIRSSSIQFITTRHEQAAGFMAATVGRLTGKPGVCLSTLGPGATNLVTAVAYAQLGAMPTLFITGQKPIKKSKQGHFQIINVIEMMRPITKFTKQVVDAQSIPSLIRESFKLAVEERPGAVHIELPEDIAREDVSEIAMFESTSARRPLAEDKAILKAISLIEQSARPLLLVGAGANRKRISKTLTAFVDKTKIPFFTTQMGKGVIDERHPQYLGTAALSTNDYIHDMVELADLIINVGHDTIEKPPFIMRPGETHRKVIHLNFSSATPDMIYAPHLEVIGDIANAVWQISEKVHVQEKWDFEPLQKMKLQIEKRFASISSPTDYPYKPHQIIQELRAHLGAEDIITLDNGMYKIWFARHYPTYNTNTLLLDNALATMGAGLPSAIAAKLINPSKKVVSICGDGGFLMNSQEIETAVRLSLDLVVVILRDDAYGMIEWKQASMGLPSFGLQFHNPDFVKYAEAYGAFGHRVESQNELATLLEKAFDLGGVHIIDVPINYEDNQKVLVEELNNKPVL